MKHMSRVAFVLAMTTFFMMAPSCLTTPRAAAAQTAKRKRGQPTAMPETLKQGVVRHKGIQAPPEGIAITQVKVLRAPSRSGVWIGVTNIKLNDADRQLVFCFSGYGAFDFDFRQGASDPVLGITFQSDEQWELYQGFEWQGEKYGSWGMLLPGKADLSDSPGDFRGSGRMTFPGWNPRSLQGEEVDWSAVERFLPLTQLWLEGGKITAMQFGGAEGIAVRVVRQP